MVQSTLRCQQYQWCEALSLEAKIIKAETGKQRPFNQIFGFARKTSAPSEPWESPLLPVPLAILGRREKTVTRITGL